MKVVDWLKPYGIDADDRLCELILSYVSLLLRWNKKISLTAVTDPDEIVRFHFGESLFAAKAVPVEKGRLADVGTGAGFPGIPLAMLFPGLDVTLVEPNAKKVAFVHEVIRTLSLGNVTVLRERVEDLENAHVKFDYLTARALGHYEALLHSAGRILAASGRLILWLGDDDARQVSRHEGWSWRPPVRMPGSHNRALVVGFPDQR